VLATDSCITEAERRSVAAEVIAHNCKYAVCCGFGSDEWEEAIDWAALEADDFSDNPKHFLMTTSHVDESIDDAIHFWWNNTSYENYESTNFAILVVGYDQDAELELQKALSDYSIPFREDSPTNKKKDNKSEMATPRKPSD